MKNYDVVVIGAGPGGYVCAIRASQNGLKTAIVDKQWLGGVCLNVGCVPSKSLLKNADLAHTLRKRTKEFGISFDNLNLDYAAAVKRSRRVSQRLTRGISFLMKKNNIDVYMGTAHITGNNQVSVQTEQGTNELLDAKNIVIATGAYSFTPPAWEQDGKHVLSYQDAILQEHLPESVVIVGAGAIGAEFSTIWNSYGTKVSLVEMLPNVLPLEDEEISRELAKAFKKKGIEIFTSHKVEAIKTNENSVSVTISSNGEEKTIEAEQVLVAIGFRPNSSSIGLEDVGVTLNKRGFVNVDDRQATNVPGIWAIGDVTGKLLLAHVASTQGILCADAIANKETHPINYKMVPSATFCQPQVASFGLTEAEAREGNREIKIGKFFFQANGKALGLAESSGFVKLIADAKYGELLGAHLIGPEVSELLPELTLAQRMEMTTEEIAHNIHTHPTLSEVLMEAAEAVNGNAIHM
ncbi:MAG: dihydrolipoyl dehydrogenase [Anaerolineaceae bacterium]|nr:dihydrolipoyl dehydrogenase [Anaerolineaceae bacterium]